MVTQIREMPRLKHLRIRIGPPQRFKPQRGPLKFSDRLLTGCLRAPRFKSWPLCMDGSQICLRQEVDGQAKEQIDQHLRSFLAGCMDTVLASFRVPAGGGGLGRLVLEHRAMTSNFSRHLEGEINNKVACAT